MIINTNIQALITNNALWQRNNDLQKNSKNLSLGTKINRAGDDPAAMAIANKMKSHIRGLEIADQNTNDAISLMRTADGALSEVTNITQRMRELAVQGANDTLTDEDRAIIQQEIDGLVNEIDAISKRIEFNGRTLLDDKFGELTFQVGDKEGMELTFVTQKIDSESLGLKVGDKIISYETLEDCSNAIETCDNALSTINSFRAEFGSTENRLEKNSNSLIVSTENANSALSRIRDTDMAYEMAQYTKNNVLVQAGIAMLSQANQRPNQLLSLLQ